MQLTQLFGLVASLVTVASGLPMEAASSRPTLRVYQAYGFADPYIDLYPTLNTCQNLADVKDPNVPSRNWANSISSIRLTLGVGFCVFYSDPDCSGKALAGPSAGLENLKNAWGGSMNDNIESYKCFGTGDAANTNAAIEAGKILKDYNDAVNPAAAQAPAVDAATNPVSNSQSGTPVTKQMGTN